jgi:ComF family protein
MINDFISMIFPDYCLMCEEALAKEEKCLCIHCRYNLPKTAFHLDMENELAKRFWGKVNIKYALAYLKFTKQGKVQHALHQLKYGGYKEIGETLGNWYGSDLKSCGLANEFDIILPVPLHPSKLKKRGYNQSDVFAKGLSETMQVSWSSDILKKIAATETQTNKKRLQRWENVKDIFSVADEKSVAQSKVLLVDDVITTGSTLEACAKVLIEAGCREVSIAAIAAA